MDYKEFDFEGEKTLKAIAAADKFNEWMYSSIKNYCNGRILEIGSGIGNISKYFISDSSDIVLSDIRIQYRNYLNSLSGSPTVIELDLVNSEFDSQYKDYFCSFDTIIALNVIEHIENDKIGLLNIQKLLKPGGNIIILAPAFKFLYNNFDRELCHFRRYTLRSLHDIMPPNSFLIKKKYFNFIGIFGWFLVGSIFQAKTIPQSNMKLYNKLVPIFKIIDKVVRNKCGLSCVIVVRID
jgi:SAM-dependent methyltransferase